MSEFKSSDFRGGSVNAIGATSEAGRIWESLSVVMGLPGKRRMDGWRPDDAKTLIAIHPAALEQLTMKTKFIPVLGSTLLLLLAGVMGFELVGARLQPPGFRRGYHLYALFNNVHGLKRGDQVKAFGLEVGIVEAISEDPSVGKVRVALKLNPHLEVKTDWVARVNPSGASGTTTVELQIEPYQSPFAELQGKPSPSPRLSPGSVLATRETP